MNVVEHLTSATAEGAPTPCRNCMWWQTRPAGKAGDSDRWKRDIEDDFGPWGKLYVDEGRVIGLIQYGPSERFARARHLPAGPPDRDAVLVTCAYLVDAHSPWVLQSLFLAAIGECRDRGLPALETFGYRYPSGEGFARGSSATAPSSRPTSCTTSASTPSAAPAASAWSGSTCARSSRRSTRAGWPGYARGWRSSARHRLAFAEPPRHYRRMTDRRPRKDVSDGTSVRPWAAGADGTWRSRGVRPPLRHVCVGRLRRGACGSCATASWRRTSCRTPS